MISESQNRLISYLDYYLSAVSILASFINLLVNKHHSSNHPNSPTYYFWQQAAFADLSFAIGNFTTHYLQNQPNLCVIMILFRNFFRYVSIFIFGGTGIYLYNARTHDNFRPFQTRYGIIITCYILALLNVIVGYLFGMDRYFQICVANHSPLDSNNFGFKYILIILALVIGGYTMVISTLDFEVFNSILILTVLQIMTLIFAPINDLYTMWRGEPSFYILLFHFMTTRASGFLNYLLFTGAL